MIDISKIKTGDLVLSGPNYEYLCKVLDIRSDGRLSCHMFSNNKDCWINVDLILDPEECTQYIK